MHRRSISVGPALLIIAIVAALSSFLTDRMPNALAANQPALSLLEVPVEEQSLLPLIVSAFESTAAGDVDAAVQTFADRAWRDNPRTTDQLRTVLSNITKIGGDYSGTELVAVRRVSPRFTEVWTISWFELGPYLFKARFYQRDGEWRFADFAGTTEMNEFVEMAPLTFVSRYEAP